MSIYLQNLLVITPIFFGLSSLICFLKYDLDLREMLWGLRQESASLAVGSAAFLDPEAIDSLRQNPDLKAAEPPDDRKIRYRRALERLIHQAEEDRILKIYSPSLLEKWFESDTTKVFELEKRVQEVIRVLQEDPFYSSDVVKLGDRHWVFSVAPVKTPDGSTYAYLAMAVDAQRLVDSSAVIIQRSIIYTAFVTGIGVIVSLVISWMIKGGLVRVRRSAQRIAAEDYNSATEGSWIEEVADLSNAFSTMSSIIKEVLAKTRRVLIGSEQFRTESDLRRNYLHRTFAPLSVVWKGCDLSVQLAGREPAEYFYVWSTTETRAILILGRLKQGPGMEVAFAASSCASVLQALLRHQTAEEALAEVGSLYPLRQAESVTLTDDATYYEHGLWKAGQSWQSRRVDLASNRLAVFPILSQPGGELIAIYAQRFQHLSAAEVAEDLHAMLEARNAGVFALIKFTNHALQNPKLRVVEE